MADGNGENNCLVTLHYATLTYSFTNDRAIDQMLNVLFLCFLYLNMSFQYYETLLGDARSRYDKKLSLVGLNECPYRLPQGSWKNDPTKWPAMEYGDMYAYLIDTPGVFTRESMKNKKSLEAHNYFESGWVETVLSYDVPDSRHLILKANVKPSQRVNNQPHKPWVALTTEGVVSSAHCDCMAGGDESYKHRTRLVADNNLPKLTLNAKSGMKQERWEPDCINCQIMMFCTLWLIDSIKPF